MRIGLYRGDAARSAADAGFASFWLPQTMGLDSMISLGRGHPRSCVTADPYTRPQ